jgi:ribosomal protein L12E/L44/L45/RPP1/RPP2
MAGTPTNPENGDRVIDGSEFVYLVDLTPKDLQGLRTAQEGLKEVLDEILSNHADWGGKAGLTAEEHAELVTTSERIARLDKFYGPLAKFTEMVEETRYLLEDKRQRVILNLASSVDRRSKNTPELLAKYEKTRTYRSAAAKKAVKTRQKNAEAQAEAQAAEEAQEEEQAGQPQEERKAR